MRTIFLCLLIPLVFVITYVVYCCFIIDDPKLAFLGLGIICALSVPLYAVFWLNEVSRRGIAPRIIQAWVNNETFIKKDTDVVVSHRALPKIFDEERQFRQDFLKWFDDNIPGQMQYFTDYYYTHDGTVYNALFRFDCVEDSVKFKLKWL